MTNVRARGRSFPAERTTRLCSSRTSRACSDTPKPLMLMGTPATAIAALDAAAGVDHRVRGSGGGEKQRAPATKRTLSYVCRSGRVVSAAMPRTNDPGSPTSEHGRTRHRRRRRGPLAIAGEPRVGGGGTGRFSTVVLAEGRRRGELLYWRSGPPGAGGAQSRAAGDNAQPFGPRATCACARTTFLRASASGVHALALTDGGALLSWRAHDANFKNLCAWACSSPRPSRRSPRASPSAASCRRRGRALIRLRGDLERGRGHGGDAREQRERARRREARAKTPPRRTPSPRAARRRNRSFARSACWSAAASACPLAARPTAARAATRRAARRRRRRTGGCGGAPDGPGAGCGVTARPTARPPRASSCRARYESINIAAAAGESRGQPTLGAFAAAMGDGAAAGGPV